MFCIQNTVYSLQSQGFVGEIGTHDTREDYLPPGRIPRAPVGALPLHPMRDFGATHDLPGGRNG